VPAGDASVLKGQLEDVRQRVDDGQCDGLSAQLRQVDNAIDGLPRSVNARLVRALSNGSTRLRSTAVTDCNVNRAKTQTETTPTETTTTPTETTTTPPETTTAPTDTTTVPPATTTTPPPTATIEIPPVDTTPVPPPPAVGQGGGTPPVIP
jgi:hypothetical protein